ncbi:hypothetical protein [Ferrimonas senticii]|uniref:hypothetical protein n=1 Tax=Ferrimonas senticii TaxID=394566 RepID=UPI0004143675|nr:hypothetical protein [Ferrimonas senticii]
MAKPSFRSTIETADSTEQLVQIYNYMAHVKFVSKRQQFDSVEEGRAACFELAEQHGFNLKKSYVEHQPLGKTIKAAIKRLKS